FPVIPHTNRSIGSGSCLRKSTHVIPLRKIGNSGTWGESGSKVGITGQPRFTNSLRKAYNSCFCQGPRSFLLTNTAADLIFPICCSNKCCQSNPGRSSHSSNQ